MLLTPGARIGPYEIMAAVGAGGMGEVYRARDTKLGRDVAIKVLPLSFTSDPDRRARFEREAQVLASLNHPNIAAIYHVEDTAGAPAIVMELVEGETLADRIARGPIPIDETLAIANQIAQALAAAHAQGIIHRDLKPANIKITPSGQVKVLDFGLAKLGDAGGAGQSREPASLSVSPTVSPTIISPALMTAAGVLLGTAAYMSPEQARGKPVDQRVDIWALGCVLYEMLSGSRAFHGTDAAETVAAVIQSEPDWSRLPPATPPAMQRVIRRCLRKDADRRLADVRDVRLEIEDGDDASPNHSRSGAVTRERLGWVAACLLTAMAVSAVTSWFGNRTSTIPSEMRVEITTPPTNDLVSLALSPDGKKLAFVASSDHRPRLWLRSLVTGVATPLSGTDGATFPFWSPDSGSIGFFANGNMYRIDVDGGSLRALTIAPVGAGGSWGRDGEILFTMVPDAPLSRVRASGGKPEFLAASQPGRTPTPAPGQRFPQFLPDGRHFLYYVAETSMRGVYLGALDSPERQRLFDADAAAVFVPPARVLFVRAGKLYAQQLDPSRLQPEGNAVSLADGISIDSVGAAAISGSSTGAIAYRVGAANRQRQFTWFNRSGAEVGVAGEPDAASPLNPALSPDGRQLALNRSTEGNMDIWLYDLRRRVFSRFTSDPRPDIYAVWSPDGSRIAYATTGRTGAGFNLFQKPIAGTTEPVPMFEAPDNMLPEDWSRDGRFVSYLVLDSSGQWDIGALPTAANGKPFPITKTPANEMSSQFSPDGRWIAYESDESGRNEIYVQSFPRPDAKTIVSTGGGLQPRWRPDGRELFYVAPDGKLMAVAIDVANGKTLKPGAPTALFVTRISSTRTGGSRHEYVISNDGQRFLMNTFVEQKDVPITLVLNPAVPGQ
jgi:eukaryotic-like serine/threonine-protein kinase